MALIRWEPVRELQTMQNEMNRLFNTFFDSPSTGANGGHAPLRRWIPAMDVVETADHFVLRADLPGISENDVNIELDDNVLTISGQRRSEHESRNEGYYRVERASGSFSRSLTLPEGVDADGIQASFDSGVLEVKIPKPEQQKPRKVQISLGGSPKTIEGAETTQEGAETTEPAGAAS
jgi:HSP20 family protein